MDGRWWRSVAAVLPAAVFTFTSQYEVLVGPLPLLAGTAKGPKPVLSALVGLVSIGLVLRLRAPLVALLFVMGPMSLHWPLDRLFGPGGPNLFEMFLAEVFIVYSTAAHTRGRRTYAGVALIAAIQLAAYGPSLPSSLQQAFGEWVFYGLAWVLGKTLLYRELRGERFEARTAELEASREADIQAAIGEERARIARELHDVVAHSVSLMTLQAGAARQALSGRPEQARDPLLSIEATGRAAMSELRRLLALLREDGQEEDGLAPQPSMRRLDVLVGQVRQAGLAVELDADGGLDALPPGVDLSAYRITQEALTNVVKHAQATRVSVRVRCAGGAIEVAVEDDGRGAGAAAANGTGHGLIGMRERVNLFGGALQAGPRPGGGFQVHARLPYEPA